MPLLVEVATAEGWLPASVLFPGDPEASMSSNHPRGRDIILFRCEQDRSVISRSTGGADWETGGGTGRAIASLGIAELAVLGPGESFELTATSDRGHTHTVRWTHQADDAS